MSAIECSLLAEPGLRFRHGQIMEDPHDGLSLFGPVDADSPAHPASLPHAAIGSPEGLALWNHWSSAMQSAWTGAPKGRLRLWAPFPGFDAAFGCVWPARPAWTHPIERVRLLSAARQSETERRVAGVVDLYLDGLSTLPSRDARVGVVICVVPDEIFANCRTQSHVEDPIGDAVSTQVRASRRAGQLELFDEVRLDQYHLSPDFRRQMKARAMKYDVPIQIVRESTLLLSDEHTWGERNLTPVSDRMWNLSTTLYYKGGGKPWRLAAARPRVCYVGLAFRRAGRNPGDATACCAAQMFVDSGDGIVFLGRYGPWYSQRDHQFHLSRSAAAELLRGTLETYAQLDGQPIEEVFLHSRSEISTEEFEGYTSACPPNVKVTGIRVRSDRDALRLYRPGQMPVLRGTFAKLSQKTGFLFTTGFKPRLGTYDGWETPVPLRLDIQHGEGDVQQIAADILGLTKLNYNACKHSDGQPVTILFSDQVGEILVSNPGVKERNPRFRSYI